MALNLLNGGLGALTGLVSTGNPIGLAGGIEECAARQRSKRCGKLERDDRSDACGATGADEWAEWDRGASQIVGGVCAIGTC